MELLPVAVLLSPGRTAVEARWLARPGHGRAAALGKEAGSSPLSDYLETPARLIVRRLGRVGDARASATIRNSESTHRRLRRVYENAAEHYRCVSTGKHGRRH